MRARIPFIVVKGRSVPVRGGRGRRSAPERKDVKYGDDGEEVDRKAVRGLEYVMALRNKAFFAGLMCVLAIICLCDCIARKVYFNQNLCGIADVLGLEKQSYSIEYVEEEPQILFSDTSLLIVLKLENPWCPGRSIVEADTADTKFGIDAINKLKPASDKDELPRTIYRFGYLRFSCYACYSRQLSKMYIWMMGT